MFFKTKTKGSTIYLVIISFSFLFSSCVTKDRAGLPCLGALEVNDPYEAQGIAGVLLNGQENNIIEFFAGATNDRKGIVQECGGIALGVSSNLGALGSDASSSSGIVYSSSTYNFTLGVQITRVTPTLNGPVSNCRTNPTLPSGVQIDPTTCAFFGNPSVSLSPTSFEILADASSGAVFRINLTISVGSATSGSGTNSSSSSSSSTSASTSSSSSGSSGGGSSNQKAPGSGVWFNNAQQQSIDGILTSLAFGNGVFLSCKQSSSFCQTSTNGINWTNRTIPETQSIWTLRFLNNRFVALASNGTNRVMTSSDGITWTTGTIAENNFWNDVAFGNGVYVAVSGDGTNRIMTSSDGLAWTARTAPEQNSWSAIAFGNNVFVAVSSDGTNRLMTSSDGTSWTASASLDQSNWDRIIFANGIFVASAQSGTSRIMTSSNGTTWTLRTAPSSTASWTGLTYGDGIFMMIASTPNDNSAASLLRAAASTDGITWVAETTIRGFNTWSRIAYGNSRFVVQAVGGADMNAVMVRDR